MSNKVKGRVQAVSPKPKKDWYGICIDDEWYNGSGDLQQNLQEAEVELELSENEEDFTRIQKINVLEEDSEDGAQSRDKSSGRGGDNNGRSNSSSPNPKRANIMATAATKKAADIVERQVDLQDLEEGEFEQLVSTTANGINNVMNKLYEENME